MVQWVNCLRNNIFVNPPHYLYCVKFLEPAPAQQAHPSLIHATCDITAVVKKVIYPVMLARWIGMDLLAS